MTVVRSPCQRQCELLSSLRRLSFVVCRPLTIHILIFCSETPQPNEVKLSRKHLWKRPQFVPTIYHTRGEHANHYATDVVPYFYFLYIIFFNQNFLLCFNILFENKERNTKQFVQNWHSPSHLRQNGHDFV
jgi:hypothetical protein